MEPEPPFEVIAAFDYVKEGNHELGFSAGDLVRCIRSGGSPVATPHPAAVCPARSNPPRLPFLLVKPALVAVRPDPATLRRA